LGYPESVSLTEIMITSWLITAVSPVQAYRISFATDIEIPSGDTLDPALFGYLPTLIPVIPATGTGSSGKRSLLNHGIYFA
jgi:hypothetical protein